MSNIFDIKGKVIIFTGSNGYLGKTISKHLENVGAKVIHVSRTEKESSNSFRLDISNDEKRQNLVSFIKKKFQKIDGLINNAYSGKAGEMLSSTREDFEESLNISLVSPFLLIKDLISCMGKGSSIINIASMYGMVSPDPRIYGNSGQNNPVYYGAGKAGLIQMTKYLACHLAKQEIRVNSISPGAFPNISKIKNTSLFYEQLKNKIPMGRLGKPEDLCGVIHFLLSSGSAYLNGTNIPVDGGWTAW